jgi:bifunctional DNA-binding transcriptional regulator/antitoxin component of YhaV-PrlF toxin-antitoxin module
MRRTGELRVSQHGRVSLPAAARHRWGLEAGGEVGYLDLGDATRSRRRRALRRQLLGSVTDQEWRHRVTTLVDDQIS